MNSNAYIFIERTFVDATSEAHPGLSWRWWYKLLLPKAKNAVENRAKAIEQKNGREELERLTAYGGVKAIVKSFGKFVHCQKMFPDVDHLDPQNRASPLYVYIVFGCRPEYSDCCRPHFDKFVAECFALARSVKQSGVNDALKVPMPAAIR